MKPDLFNAIFCRPWAIEGLSWSSLAQSFRAGPASLSWEDFLTPRQEMEIDQNGIAHIYVTGVLGFVTPGEEKVFGDSAYSTIEAEIAEAKANARGIMYHIDSPGGSAVHCVETAEVAAKTGLPTASICGQMACSAAYAFASGTDRIAARPSSMVGSIGTIMPLLDASGFWEAMGFKPDYIQSGDLKAAGYAPSQTEAERAALQQEVDDLGAMFRAHVLTYRNVPADAMRGQAFVAQRAKQFNIVDDATGNYEALYADLVSRSKRRR